jgi:tetratricopeptide (TPR) repeat protein/serine/threonine protein kinase
MNASRPDNEAIFHAARDIPDPERRREYVREACGGDETRISHVEALLAAADAPDSLLDRPAGSDPVATIDQPTPESPGALIGPYKLIEQIGEGGMGSVWMAQQTQPVKRLVAVKLIKAGMDSKQVIARFEAERQALALMDHPNIARVLDGGTTRGEPGGVSPGRPYFVMDLVKGVPITRYCDEHHLTPRQRLELFLPVCQAMQHAHQKGIIHRDLKPSNVLVAPYDGKAVVKVIDFGVAKAAGQQLTDRTLVTGFGAVVGTLEYMSPEQAELNNHDIDTRSDIYALGVLLYELLAGSPPFSRKELEKAGMVEMLRVIREQEPTKPSAKLSTAEGLPTLAANRGTEPAKLTALVRGELDWIVMKALEKDRNRRYETANGFAMDVQRYLADEPVLACPPSAGYRLRKLLRRHRAGLLTTAALLLVVLLAGGGLGAVLWERAAQHAARRATTERIVSAALASAAELSAQAQQMPNATSVQAAAVLVVWQKAQDALAQAEAALNTGADDDLLRQRVADLRTQLDKGQARALRKEKLFRDLDEARLARLVCVDNQFDDAGCAAKYAAAFAAYDLDVTAERRDELARRIAAEEPQVREALLVALGDWAYAAQFGTRWSEKDLLELARAADSDAWRQRFYHAAATRDRPALRNLSVEAPRSSVAPSNLLLLALHLWGAGEHEESLALLRWGRGRHPADFWLHLELGTTLVYRKGETPTAVELEEVIGCDRAALALRPQASSVHNNLGVALWHKGQLDEAIAVYREALRLEKDNAFAHCNLGVALRDKGQLDEAIAECREALRLKKDFAAAHCGLGYALLGKGQLDEAIAECREAIRLKKDIPEAHYNLGNALKAKGQPDEGIAALREAVRLKKDYAAAHNNLGIALRDKGQWDEAIAECREAIRLKNYPEAHNNLGAALAGKGRLNEAIAAYREAIRLQKDYATPHYNLGNALYHKGQLDEAIAAFREAVRLKKDYAMAYSNLGNALNGKGQWDEAIAACREAIRLKKDDAGAHNNLGNGLRGKRQLDEAIAAYREAIRLEKDDAVAHNNLGIALAEKGQLDEAIAAFREAVRLKKDYANAYGNLGNALNHKGQFDEAIASYRKVIELDPTHALAHCKLGDALRRQNNLDEAIVWFRKAIHVDPKCFVAHLNLGNALLLQKKLDEAIACYRAAIAIDAKDAAAQTGYRNLSDFAGQYLRLGNTMLQLKKLDEAIACYRKAIELDEKLVSAHVNLGMLLCDHLRDYPKAEACFRKAIQLDSKSAITHYNLGTSLYRQKKLDEAVAAFRKAIKLTRKTPAPTATSASP